MKNKLYTPAIVVLFVFILSAACSFGAPRPAAATVTPLSPVQTLPQATEPPALASSTPAGGAAAATTAPTAAPTAGATAPSIAGPSLTSTPEPENPALFAGVNQPVEIKGSFSYTNDIITTYYVEDQVSLTDMYGFVKRDKNWIVPVSSQFLGYLQLDPTKKTGTFQLNLPALPTGQQVSVNPKGPGDKGVQIYALEFSANLAGSPYSTGDDPERGWPSYLASVKTDTENNDEVTGGKLVIWAPDAQESFPSDFGPDGKLFTQDDPVMSVPQGYSVIDLDQKPFKIIRDAQPEMTLYEPKDAAIKDFSKLSYKDAFDQMFAIARKEYAFNGIQGKQPDWDKLYADLSPRVAKAGQAKDPEGFFMVMRDFTLAFHDGHVNLDGGDVGQKVLGAQYAGGFGFAVRRLDDGRVMVIYVTKGSPAEQAGMKVGAIVTQFNGKPIQDEIAAVSPPGPVSMESNLRDEQARYLTRAPVGAKVSVSFTNPGGAPQNVTLTAVDERESLSATSPYRNFDPNGLPVDYVVATSEDVGYVRINSNYDDLNLIIRLFERALTKFKENNLNNLIIDMRVNSGGANLGLAGFLTDKEIPMGQLQYYSDEAKKFVPEGPTGKITPNVEQFRFRKMFLLVDSTCASACELEAYGFSQVPGMVVVGEHPSSGTEAEVARGQFKLPEGMSLQIPTGRFVLPDGSLFLEGKGVPPSVVVPVDENTALSQQDVVLQKALSLSK